MTPSARRGVVPAGVGSQNAHSTPARLAVEHLSVRQPARQPLWDPPRARVWAGREVGAAGGPRGLAGDSGCGRSAPGRAAVRELVPGHHVARRPAERTS